jgi:hypothetical protein
MGAAATVLTTVTVVGTVIVCAFGAGVVTVTVRFAARSAAEPAVTVLTWRRWAGCPLPALTPTSKPSIKHASSDDTAIANRAGLTLTDTSVYRW